MAQLFEICLSGCLDVVLWMCFCKSVLVSVQVSVISGEKKGNSPLDFFTFFIRFVMGFAAMLLLTHFSLFWERSKSVSQRVTKLPRRCLYHNICIDVYILIIYLSTLRTCHHVLHLPKSMVDQQNSVAVNIYETYKKVSLWNSFWHYRVGWLS